MNIRPIAAFAALLLAIAPVAAIASGLNREIQTCSGMEETEAEACFDKLAEACGRDHDCLSAVSNGRDHAETLRLRAETARLKATASTPVVALPPAPAPAPIAVPAPAPVASAPVMTEPVTIFVGGYVPAEGAVKATTYGGPCQTCLRVELFPQPPDRSDPGRPTSAFGIAVDGEELPILYRGGPHLQPTRSDSRPLWAETSAGAVVLEFTDFETHRVRITEYRWIRSRGVYEAVVSRTSSVSAPFRSTSRLTNLDGI
jgi:hypothetical protein